MTHVGNGSSLTSSKGFAFVGEASAEAGLERGYPPSTVPSAGRSPLMTWITRKRLASSVGTASTASGAETSRCAVDGWPHPMQRGHAAAPTHFKSNTATSKCRVIARIPALSSVSQLPRPSPLQLLCYRLQVLLYLLQALLCRIFQFGTNLSRHLHEHPPPQRFAHLLELRLLLCVKQRLDRLVYGDADVPQLL